jgi:hypothetical protein
VLQVVRGKTRYMASGEVDDMVMEETNSQSKFRDAAVDVHQLLPAHIIYQRDRESSGEGWGDKKARLCLEIVVRPRSMGHTPWLPTPSPVCRSDGLA